MTPQRVRDEAGAVDRDFADAARAVAKNARVNVPAGFHSHTIALNDPGGAIGALFTQFQDAQYSYLIAVHPPDREVETELVGASRTEYALIRGQR